MKTRYRQLDPSYALEQGASHKITESAQYGHEMYKLFGQELDAYVNAHVEAYNESKKKWSDCSMDEWKSGADGAYNYFVPCSFVSEEAIKRGENSELTSKFAQMLDFVRCFSIVHGLSVKS